MYTTHYTFKLFDKRYRPLFANAAIAATLLFIISFFLFFIRWSGQVELATDLYSFIASLVCLAFATSVYFSRRFPIVIHGANDQLSITIHDPAFEKPLVIESPFYIRKQWYFPYHRPSKPDTSVTVCASVIDRDGTPVVTFMGSLRLSDDLHGFEFIEVLIPEEKAQLTKAPIVYTTRNIMKITEEVRIYQDFMERRARNSDAERD